MNPSIRLKDDPEYSIFKSDTASVLKKLGKEKLLYCLKEMLLIRNFETRAESAYLEGKIGGFFHSYIGQEAVQTAAVAALGKEHWWTTSYRCHALALLLGATPSELMAELYGKATGNAKGRGGSMHLYTERLLGGFGIVGGQIPIAIGAAFTAKYVKSGEVSICFFGDGAVAQGAFHESLNLASLWSLPCLFVIENNGWGMGTAVSRAISAQPIGEKNAVSYAMNAYTLEGMDLLNCYAGFQAAFEEVKKTGRPVLIEVLTSRFKGHSISDPAAYRSKQDLVACMERDPIKMFVGQLIENHIITEEEYRLLDKEQKNIVLDAMKYADESPFPDVSQLGLDVFAP